MNNITRTEIQFQIATALLEERGIAFRSDADVVATEGNWFIESDVTRDLVVFASFYALEDGDVYFGIDVRSRRTEDIVPSYGGVTLSEERTVSGRAAADAFRAAIANVSVGRPIGE